MDGSRTSTEVDILNEYEGIDNAKLVAAAHAAGLTPRLISTPREVTGRIALLHLGDDEWRPLVEGAPPGVVRVRISRVRLAPPATSAATASGALILHLLPKATELGEAEWAAILSVLAQPADCELLAKGGNPGGIRSYFFDTFPETLAALALLAQGYLATLVNPETKAPEVDDPSARAACAAALEGMGWTEFLTNRGPGYALLREELKSAKDAAVPALAAERRAKLRDNASSAEWWAVFEPEGPSDAAVRAEWGDGHREGMAKVLQLAEHIRDKRAIPPQMVAEAYLALARKLADVSRL